MTKRLSFALAFALLSACSSQKQAGVDSLLWDTSAAAPEETRVVALGQVDRIMFPFEASPAHVSRPPSHLEVQPGNSPRELVVIPLKKGEADFVVFRKDGSAARRISYRILTSESFQAWKNITRLLEGVQGITIEPVDGRVAVKGKVKEKEHAAIVERVQRAYYFEMMNLVSNTRDQCEHYNCNPLDSQLQDAELSSASMSSYALPNEVAAEMNAYSQGVGKLSGKNSEKVKELANKTIRKLASLQHEYAKQGKIEEAQMAREQLLGLKGYTYMHQWYAPYESEIGKKLILDITGDTSGAVWGNGPYTADSAPAAAAVHAGVVKVGESATVEIAVLEGKPYYAPDLRNGVTAWHYGAWPVSYTIKKYQE